MQEFMGKQQREPELCPFLEVLGISDDELHPVKVLEYIGGRLGPDLLKFMQLKYYK